MNVDHVRLRIEMILPHAFEQHGAGDDLARMAHEIFEQAEFARLQVDVGLAALGGAGQKIEFEIAHLEPRLDGSRAAAAHQRIDAREQFHEGVRLRQIVVAAGLEPFHAIVHFGQRAQEQHRRQIAVLADLLDELQPIELRQHAIDDGHVVGSRQRQRETDLAVGGVVDDVTRFLETVHQIALRLEIILNDENPHSHTPDPSMPTLKPGPRRQQQRGGWGRCRRRGGRTTRTEIRDARYAMPD